jgi:hypothetical protein
MRDGNHGTIALPQSFVTKLVVPLLLCRGTQTLTERATGFDTRNSTFTPTP